MPSTTTRQIPYPAATDAPDAAGAFYAQAQKLETEWADGTAGIGWAGSMQNSDPANPSRLFRQGRIATLILNVNPGVNGGAIPAASLIGSLPAGFIPATYTAFEAQCLTATGGGWGARAVVALSKLDGSISFQWLERQLANNDHFHAAVTYVVA